FCDAVLRPASRPGNTSWHPPHAHAPHTPVSRTRRSVERCYTAPAPRSAGAATRYCAPHRARGTHRGTPRTRTHPTLPFPGRAAAWSAAAQRRDPWTLGRRRGTAHRIAPGEHIVAPPARARTPHSRFPDALRRGTL